MNLIAVNISKVLVKKGALAATERAWKLNETKFREVLPEFVIGVASGKICAYYRLQNVNPDKEPGRLKFSLMNCDKNEVERIDKFTNGKNLKYFVTKLNWTSK